MNGQMLDENIRRQVKELFADCIEPVEILFFGSDDRDRCPYCGDTSQLLVHTERGSTLYANLLAQLVTPEFPMPMGVLYRHDRSTYDQQANVQVADAIAKQGPGDLAKLMYSGMVWEVGADGTRH